ncbi:MAG: class I SAM-dependent methyltransferase [Thiofilum sp.]|uniref:class I SAM-dependent methyltransferase n=1 Tax=Thiofilum sp. TaxID=2212733 RepID=UPI0025E793CC|nr:class I SAM-dependent methyltransferase [Thiofilum sp.]MBK8453059.1 class I SAM-dependent methyltransferase [Thiofilum sp.]
MQTWMEGYESDVEYTTGYYREQEPNFLSLCAATHGIQTLDLDKPFTYLELGCGYGMTSLVMAANYPHAQFIAVDFNPTHIAQAQSLASEAGLTNITFLEKSFAQLNTEPHSIPDCDFIALHGIFTWVSDENRQHIVDICERHLKAGGIVYNSYNAKPGWSMAEPIQKLLYATSKQFSGSSLERFDQSVKLIQQLQTVKPRFFATNEAVIQKRLEGLVAKDRHYLVHEYLHEGWRAFYFTEIANWLRQAKLEFIGGAVPTDALIRTQLTPATDKLLAQIHDNDTRELYLDIIKNTVFRRDIFSRGVIGRLDQNARVRWFNESQWMLAKPARFDDEAFNFKPALNKDLYRSLIDHLAAGVCSFSTLANGKNRRDTVNALLQLYQANMITPYYANTAHSVMRFNQAMIKRNQPLIALPHSRSSLRLKTFDAQFYINAIKLNTQDATKIAQAVFQELESKQMTITHKGETLSGIAMKNHLANLATKWHSDILPILKQGGAI